MQVARLRRPPPGRATRCALVLAFGSRERDLGGNDVASWRRCCRAAPCAVADAACRGPVAPRGQGHGARGHHDLQARSAYQPTIHNQGGRWIAYIGHHGGTHGVPKPRNPLTGARGVQRHVHHRRHRPAPAEVPGAHPRRRGQGRGRRRADGARVRRQGPAEGRSRAPSTCCARSATRRTRSGTRPTPRSRKLVTRLDGPQGHAQELVGVRHRHRLPGLGRRRMARRPHDARSTT